VRFCDWIKKYYKMKTLIILLFSFLILIGCKPNQFEYDIISKNEKRHIVFYANNTFKLEAKEAKYSGNYKGNFNVGDTISINLKKENDKNISLIATEQYILINNKLFEIEKVEDQNARINLEEREIINLCIDTISKEFKIKEFLVYPYFKSFDFNNFSFDDNIRIKNKKNSTNKKNVLDVLDWNNERFSFIKASVDKQYQNKYCDELLDFSSSNKSNCLMSFSGISREVLFVEIIYFCDSIEKNKLKEKINFNQEIRNATYLILLLKEKQVLEIITDSHVIYELNCEQ